MALSRATTLVRAYYLLIAEQHHGNISSHDRCGATAVAGDGEREGPTGDHPHLCLGWASWTAAQEFPAWDLVGPSAASGLNGHSPRAWTTALVLDGLEGATGRTEFGRSAQTAIKVGLIGAVGAALTGVTDWQHTEQRARRLGLLHGVLNTVAAALYTTSLVQRHRQHRAAGRWWACLGFVVASGAAYLGGDLVYGERIGVNHAAREPGPGTFTPVLAAHELAEGQMRQVEVEGTPILLCPASGASVCPSRDLFALRGT